MYICKHINVYIYIYVYVYIYIYMHMYMYIQICIYIYSYKYVYIYIQYVCMCIYIYIHIVCMYVCMNVYIQYSMYIYICSRPPMIYPAHVSIAMRRVPQDTCELYHKSKRNICMVPVCEFTMFVPLPRHRRRCWRYIMGCVCVTTYIYIIIYILCIYRYIM